RLSLTGPTRSADEEADSHERTRAPAPIAVTPHAGIARVPPDRRGSRRVLVRPFIPSGRSPEWSRRAGPSVNHADAGAERPTHDRLRTLPAGTRCAGGRPVPPARARRAQYRPPRADEGEPHRVNCVHALPRAHPPAHEP